MIDIYLPGNVDFAHNGNIALMPTRCEITATINGAWTLELEHHIDVDNRWTDIVEEAVLKVPTWQADKQLYRIATVKKDTYGITATAYPIFMDSANDVFIMDKRPTNRTGQEALDILLSSTGYTGISDLGQGSAYFVRRNFIDLLCGKESPTFLERWGGEIEYDNKTIRVMTRLGADHGVEIRYGKNISAISYDVDTSVLATRIVPLAFNGRKMSGLGYVDSTEIGAHPVIYTKVVNFDTIRLQEDIQEGEDTTGYTVCADQAALDAALDAAARSSFVTVPQISIDVDMLTLNDPALGSVTLGDTIFVRYSKLGISTKLRAMSVTWDCIRKRPIEFVIGQVKSGYVETVAKAVM